MSGPPWDISRWFATETRRARKNSMADAVLTLRPPLIEGDKSIAQVTHDVCAPMEARPSRLWWLALAASSSLLLLGVLAIGYQVAVGVGTWGLNRTIGWAFDITNFVFWIGIGHAGKDRARHEIRRK